IAATVEMGLDASAGQPTLEAELRNHGEVWAVIGDDEAGIQAANAIRRPVGGRRYLVAGYYTGRNYLPTLMTGVVSGLAERSIEILVRRAVKAAVDRARGESLPAKIEVPIEFRAGVVMEPASQPTA